MKKEAKVALIAFSAVAVVGVGYWLATRDKNADEDIDSNLIVDTATGAATALVPKCSRVAAFPLKKGSVGSQVKDLQKFLNEFTGGVKIVEDCDFGTKTQNKLDVFLREQNLQGQLVNKSFYDSVIIPSLRNKKLNIDSRGSVRW